MPTITVTLEINQTLQGTQSIHNKQKPHIHTTGVPHGGVLLPTLFNIYTSDLPPPRAQVQVMPHADDIAITSTHTSTSAAKKNNNLTLNPDKTTLFIPDAADYTGNLDLKINNTVLPMATHPKVLGLNLDPKLTYCTHIHNILVHAHKPLKIIKVLTKRGWGKQKDTLMTTYKGVMTPALGYDSSIWSPLLTSTSINCHRIHRRHKHTRSA